jgi:hypothetical protein
MQSPRSNCQLLHRSARQGHKFCTHMVRPTASGVLPASSLIRRRRQSYRNTLVRLARAFMQRNEDGSHELAASICYRSNCKRACERPYTCYREAGGMSRNSAPLFLENADGMEGRVAQDIINLATLDRGGSSSSSFLDISMLFPAVRFSSASRTAFLPGISFLH